MLRRLLTPTALTSMRSHFPKHKVLSVFVLGRRALSNDSTISQKPRILKAMFRGAILATSYWITAICLGATRYRVKCENTYALDLMENDDANDEVGTKNENVKKGEKNTDVIEEGKVALRIEQPTFREKYDSTLMELETEVEISLPEASLARDYEQLCHWLKHRLSDVEQSESGARLGLAQFALRYMQDGVDTHVNKNCSCGLIPSPKESPSRLSFLWSSDPLE